MKYRWLIRLPYFATVIPGYGGYLLLVAKFFSVFGATNVTICICLIGFIALEKWYIIPMLRLGAKLCANRIKSQN